LTKKDVFEASFFIVVIYNPYGSSPDLDNDWLGWFLKINVSLFSSIVLCTIEKHFLVLPCWFRPLFEFLTYWRLSWFLPMKFHGWLKYNVENDILSSLELLFMFVSCHILWHSIKIFCSHWVFTSIINECNEKRKLHKSSIPTFHMEFQDVFPFYLECFLSNVSKRAIKCFFTLPTKKFHNNNWMDLSPCS